MVVIIIALFFFLLRLLFLVLLLSPILPDSLRASGYPGGVLVCLCKQSGIDFTSIFPRSISLDTVLLPLSRDKVEKTHLAR